MNIICGKEVKQLYSISEVDGVLWNQLVGSNYPFLRHEFLMALEQSGCVSEKTGWIPRHFVVNDASGLVALMPLYLKMHSRGEYVFDQQWAQAYHQLGEQYYPKWLTAIPFTPCQGARIVCRGGVDQQLVIQLLLENIQELSELQAISSWHCLFPDVNQVDQFRLMGLAIRADVQFHWFNRGYPNFDGFLQTLTSSKRKMIRRERRRVAEQGIAIKQLIGHEVTMAQWQVFYRFYTMTYLKKGMQPYLNLAFFIACGQAIGELMLLVLALKDGQYVGAALSFIGSDTLYGRYWGCHQEFDFLHFEACYYQGLDYCIDHGLQHFDSGAQGEHKIARGFEPMITYSAHWIKDARLAKAIEQFLIREHKAVATYRESAASCLPFKNSQDRQ